ncbi:MAG: serine/threonine-protein kinase, partial [Polyangiales bacterium]
MGTVYEALQDGSKVALKSLNRCSGEQIYRFKQEFRLLADVSHPHVIKVRELVVEDDRWFFTMELIDGVPIDRHARALAHALGLGLERTRTREHFEQLRHLFHQLVEGVAAVHRIGLIHRDLKPSNVLVERGGRVVILDFGLVSALTFGGVGQTIDGAIAGTPGYLAPEVVLHGPVTPAADWYAVGVMLYEILTQQLPVRGAVSELLNKKATEDPAPPASLARDTPADLNELCCALLRRDPSQRPTTDQILALCRSWQRRVSVGYTAHRTEQAPGCFIGRTRLLHDLTAAYRESEREPQLVVIEGASGTGKSALLTHFGEHLQLIDDPVVLAGRCYERERVPYKGLDAIIDAFTRMLLRLSTEQAAQLLPRRIGCLARIFPALLRVELFQKVAQSERVPDEPLELQRGAVGALREMLSRLADQRPLVLLIDDLHWADADGSRLLAEVLAPPEAPRMLVVATKHAARSGDTSALSMLTHLRALATHHLQLQPLTAAESCELACHYVSELGVASRIAAESGGVPMFLIELAQHAIRGAPTEGEVGLEELMAQRVDALSPQQRIALELVAIAGRP